MKYENIPVVSKKRICADTTSGLQEIRARNTIEIVGALMDSLYKMDIIDRDFFVDNIIIKKLQELIKDIEDKKVKIN